MSSNTKSNFTTFLRKESMVPLEEINDWHIQLNPVPQELIEHEHRASIVSSTWSTTR